MRTWVALVIGALALASCGTTEPSGASPPAAERVVIGQAPIGTMAQLLGPWSRTPFRLEPALAAAVDRTCRLDMDTFPVGIPLRAFDARGDGFTQVYYASPDGSFAVCNGIAIRPNGPPTGMGSGSTGRSDDHARALDRFELLVLDGGSEGRPTIRSFVGGRAGAGIAHVRIVVPGQQPIIASYMNNWFGAWFPGPWPVGWHIAGFDAAGALVADVPGR